MQINCNTSQFNCKCQMPWKSNTHSETKVNLNQAKKYYLLSHQNTYHKNPLKSKTYLTQLKSHQSLNLNSQPAQTKRSLKRQKNNYQQIRSNIQNLINYQKTSYFPFNKYKNNQNQSLCSHRNLLKQDYSSSFYTPLKQLNLQNLINKQSNSQNIKEKKWQKYNVNTQITTPIWKQAQSDHSSPATLSKINSYRQTPSGISPKKIHFPLTTYLNHQTKSMKGLQRKCFINRYSENQNNKINNLKQKETHLFQGLLNSEQPQSKMIKNNNSFLSHNQCIQGQISKSYKNSNKLQIKKSNKNLFNFKANTIKFSNFSESTSRNSSKNNFSINNAYSRKIISKENSVNPFHLISPRKVSSIFDSRQNENEISVVIPGATLITQMSQQQQAQSPKFQKIRKISCEKDGNIILKQIKCQTN